jgi:SAM-dependent methyltransferase
MKKLLLDTLACPSCGGAYASRETALVCQKCGASTPLIDGIPLFTSLLPGMRPSARLERGPEVGTPWRRANWRFLQAELAALPPEAVILDVGAGRGDFTEAFQGRRCLALDVYPYPEVDLVCDLTQITPLRAASLDAIVLLNVLEHVEDSQRMLATLARLLKPGGVLLIAIPFLVKIHQAPIDYVRYTHYALERLGAKTGLTAERIEGFYDPISLLGEGLGNLRYATLPHLPRTRRLLGRGLLWLARLLSAALARVVGPGKALPVSQARSQSPTGYQIVYRKKAL